MPLDFHYAFCVNLSQYRVSKFPFFPQFVLANSLQLANSSYYSTATNQGRAGQTCEAIFSITFQTAALAVSQDSVTHSEEISLSVLLCICELTDAHRKQLHRCPKDRVNTS